MTPSLNEVSQYNNQSFQAGTLPEFIIIGAQKSGTTSLHFYLDQHPQLVSSSKKEVHFFDGGLDPDNDDFAKGEEWYRSHFPLKENLDFNQKTFESTPLYLFNPLVPGRMYDLLPRVKLIAVLRNPTERAISQYFHEKRLQMETLPISEALQEEEHRIEEIIKHQDYKNQGFIHFTYKSRGLYKVQLERYFDYFPRKQILVINSDEFFNKTTATLKKVFEFVGVDSGFKVENLEAKSVSKNRTKIEPEVYKYLNSYFRPHNQTLYELIGENFNW